MPDCTDRSSQIHVQTSRSTGSQSLQLWHILKQSGRPLVAHLGWLARAELGTMLSWCCSMSSDRLQACCAHPSLCSPLLVMLQAVRAECGPPGVQHLLQPHSAVSLGCWQAPLNPWGRLLPQEWPAQGAHPPPPPPLPKFICLSSCASCRH